jgi:hypothetical protein
MKGIQGKSVSAEMPKERADFQTDDGGTISMIWAEDSGSGIRVLIRSYNRNGAETAVAAIELNAAAATEIAYKIRLLVADLIVRERAIPLKGQLSLLDFGDAEKTKKEIE